MAQTQQSRLNERTNQLFRDHQQQIYRGTDRLFAALMFFQWSGVILAANWFTPQTWIGQSAHLERHIWGSVLLGAVLTVVAVLCALVRPGYTSTRHAIAVSQMLMAGLLIHDFGGRIEIHFYVFGSLAFLAFYRDWRVLVSATMVTVLDHMMRGTWWPQSIFGATTASSWRWLEHVGLLLFADVFLIRSCLLSVQEMQDIAAKRAELEATNEIIEAEVRKQTAELRDAREVAETANRAKTAFLENVSHELRTPLNGILGMTELGLETELTADQREYLTTVQESAESLLVLLNDVLDFATIEARKFELAPVSFRLRDCLRSVFGPMVAPAGNDSVKVSYQVAADVPEVLVGDDKRLSQVLAKIVGNAVKFTPQGEVRTNVELNGQQQDHVELRFTVSDTGVGIPEEKRDTIFNAFEQADASSTRQFGGAGLGLTIAHQVIELMGGKMWLESTLNRGSTFHFTARFGLPSAVAGEVAEPASPVDAPGPVAQAKQSLRVLVAEDNRVNQAFAVRLLNSQGHAVLLANNGAEAVDTWEREAVDLVLMDLQMPQVDGFQATATIRKREMAAGTHTPILAVTAHADREQCLAAGLDGYVAKPIRGDALFAEIARVLRLDSVMYLPQESPVQQTDTIQSVDKDELLARINDDTEFLGVLVELFAEDGGKRLQEVRDALSNQDRVALAQAAHSLKGMLGNLSAHAAMQMAVELETIGKEGILDRAAACVSELEQEIVRVTAALDELLRSG